MAALNNSKSKLLFLCETYTALDIEVGLECSGMFNHQVWFDLAKEMQSG